MRGIAVRILQWRKIELWRLQPLVQAHTGSKLGAISARPTMQTSYILPSCLTVLGRLGNRLAFLGFCVEGLLGMAWGYFLKGSEQLGRTEEGEKFNYSVSGREASADSCHARTKARQVLP